MLGAMAHAFVRISGYGVRLLPRAPYLVRPTPPTLELTSIRNKEEHHESVDSQTPLGTHPFGDVFEGPSRESWQVEVGGVYVASIPADLMIRSWPEPDQPPFYMLSDGQGSMVYVQGPFPADKTPTIDGLGGEGQTLVARSKPESRPPWVEFSYTHKGEAWRQRHILMRLPGNIGCVVSVQARPERASAMGQTALRFAATLAPDPREDPT